VRAQLSASTAAGAPHQNARFLKYLGKLNGHHGVLAESGAGTSSSSVERRVMLLDVQGNPPALVLVNTFSNGSFVPIDARISGGKLLYKTSIQGFQFAELVAGDVSSLGLSPGDFPESQMLANTDVAEFENGSLKRVSLVRHSNEPSRGTKCFVQNHEKYVDGKRTKLSPAALRAFVGEVITCVKTAR